MCVPGVRAKDRKFVKGKTFVVVELPDLTDLCRFLFISARLRWLEATVHQLPSAFHT